MIESNSGKSSIFNSPKKEEKPKKGKKQAAEVKVLKTESKKSVPVEDMVFDETNWLDVRNPALWTRI